MSGDWVESNAVVVLSVLAIPLAPSISVLRCSSFFGSKW